MKFYDWCQCWEENQGRLTLVHLMIEVVALMYLKYLSPHKISFSIILLSFEKHHLLLDTHFSSSSISCYINIAIIKMLVLGSGMLARPCAEYLVRKSQQQCDSRLVSLPHSWRSGTDSTVLSLPNLVYDSKTCVKPSSDYRHLS